MTKSASSTIDNITAQSLIEEFTKEDSEPKENPKEAQESNKEEELTEKATNIPIVKSKEDLEREKREREEVDEDSQSTDEASEEDIKPHIRFPLLLVTLQTFLLPPSAKRHRHLLRLFLLKRWHHLSSLERAASFENDSGVVVAI